MNIEHRIVIGMIVSTEYLQRITPLWNPRFLKGPGARTLATWAMEYYDKYNESPGKEIWPIYFAKRENMEEELAQDIGSDILPNIAEKNEQEEFNLKYLLDQTDQFFQERNLEIFAEDINGHLLSGNVLEAENLASEYKPAAKDLGNYVDFSDEKSLDKIEKAFTSSSDILIKYPRQLGEFWNDDLKRGGFVALMSIEKRGKTFWLMDMAIRAAIGGVDAPPRKVAFFQAGDMTEDDQIMRMCVHLSGRSNRAEYSGKMWQPMRDCIWNQLNTCEKDERQCDFGALDSWTEKQIRDDINRQDVLQAIKDNPDYEPCRNCEDFWKKRGHGSVWLERINTGSPLTLNEAKEIFRKQFVDKRSMRLSTHINGSLTVKNITSILDIWEKQHNFVADVVIIDYADLLTTEYKIDFRHQQNEIWRQLRGLSEERHCLVATATQADAKGYTKDRLSMENFSEDKRKFGHVTAMWGLNQDRYGREKSLGMMRINDLVKREGAFHESNEITVLHNLSRGKPFLYSYFT